MFLSRLGLMNRYDASVNNDLQANPLLPKITMVGISMGEGGQMSKANLKKTMEDLTKELEQASEKTAFNDEKDPLFVANVGDYSRIAKLSSTWDSLMKSGSVSNVIRFLKSFWFTLRPTDPVDSTRHKYWISNKTSWTCQYANLKGPYRYSAVNGRRSCVYIYLIMCTFECP